MRLICLSALVFALVASYVPRTAGQSSPCPAGSSEAELQITTVSRHFGCGRFGLTETVFSARVIRTVSGVPVRDDQLLVSPCAGPGLRADRTMMMCVGVPAPSLPHQRFDDFLDRPGPRLYALPVSEYRRRGRRRHPP